MKRYDERLLDFIKEDLDEYVSNICVVTKVRNKKYKELIEKRANIINNNEGLRHIFEDFDEMNLSADELKILPKLVELERDINHIEEREIYKAAMLDCVDILKELNIIKSDGDR